MFELIVHHACETPRMICEHVLIVPPSMETAAKTIQQEMVDGIMQIEFDEIVERVVNRASMSVRFYDI